MEGLRLFTARDEARDPGADESGAEAGLQQLGAECGRAGREEARNGEGADRNV